jgi:hypothetical protein
MPIWVYHCYATQESHAQGSNIMVTWSPYCGLIALIFWSALFDDSLTRSHVNHMFPFDSKSVGNENWSNKLEYQC